MSNPRQNSQQPPCPANGLARAHWFRALAADHPDGSEMRVYAVATAAMIEARIEGESGMRELALRTPAELIGDAANLRMQAARLTGAHRAAQLARAAELERRAIGG